MMYRACCVFVSLVRATGCYFLRASSGDFFANGVETRTLFQVHVGDSVRFKLNMDDGKLFAALNDDPYVPAAEDLKGTLYPLVCTESGGAVEVSVGSVDSVGVAMSSLTITTITMFMCDLFTWLTSEQTAAAAAAGSTSEYVTLDHSLWMRQCCVCTRIVSTDGSAFVLGGVVCCVCVSVYVSWSLY